eukprot:6204735-Pleurochrysis_carterae.AAC.1
MSEGGNPVFQSDPAQKVAASQLHLLQNKIEQMQSSIAELQIVISQKRKDLIEMRNFVQKISLENNFSAHACARLYMLEEEYTLCESEIHELMFKLETVVRTHSELRLHGNIGAECFAMRSLRSNACGSSPCSGMGSSRVAPKPAAFRGSPGMPTCRAYPSCDGREAGMVGQSDSFAFSCTSSLSSRGAPLSPLGSWRASEFPTKKATGRKATVRSTIVTRGVFNSLCNAFQSLRLRSSKQPFASITPTNERMSRYESSSFYLSGYLFLADGALFEAASGRQEHLLLVGIVHFDPGRNEFRIDRTLLN